MELSDFFPSVENDDKAKIPFGKEGALLIPMCDLMGAFSLMSINHKSMVRLQSQIL
jgi:hypothetical protein